MLAQTKALLIAMPQLGPHSLYLISGGGDNFVANDLLPAAKQLSNEQVATAAAADIVRVVRTLWSAGAREYLVNVSSEDSESAEPSSRS